MNIDEYEKIKKRISELQDEIMELEAVIDDDAIGDLGRQIKYNLWKVGKEPQYFISNRKLVKF